MKKLILNMPVKNYRDIINNDQDLKNKFTPGTTVKGTFKEGVMKILGNNYSKMAAAAQRAMEVPPLCEMFIHELLQTNHIGSCINNDQAIRIAVMLNELYLTRPEFTINTQPIISNVSEDDFNILQHLLETYDGENKEDYISYWNDMVNDLNN